MSPPVHLTTQHCLDLAESVRRSLLVLGVSLPPHTELMKLLAECDWAASYSGLLLDPKGGPLAANSERSLRLMLKLPQLRDIARTLERCVEIDGGDVRRIRSALKRRFDRTVTVESEAQNILFELEVAASLQDAGVKVEFEEPDVVAWVDGVGSLGFACKRVQNLDRLRERLVEAGKQIQRSELPGVVVVDVQPILYRSGDEEKRIFSDQAESRDQLAAHHAAEIQGQIGFVSSEIQKARSLGAVAIVFCAMVTGTTVPKPGDEFFEYSYAWLVELPPSASSVEARVARLLGSRKLDWRIGGGS